MRPYVTDLTCPCCKGKIREPFSRFSGPVTYLHYRGPDRRACRLLVIPDPEGHDHSVRTVPAGQSLEAALGEAVQAWRARAA